MKELGELLFSTSDDDVHYLMKLYGMTESEVDEGLAVVKGWYAKQPHLPQDAFDDDTIKRLYATNKYSMEKTKEKIENLLTARTILPEFYRDRDPLGDDIVNVSKAFQMFMVPRMTYERYRVVVTRYTDVEATRFDPIAAYKLLFMLSDMRMKYEATAGDIYIWDLKYMKISHALKHTPSLLKKIFFLAQDCYGSRIKGVYILNMPNYVKNTINLIKSIIKKKIADRIQILDSLEQLHELVPKECLPSDMGGTNRSCEKLMAMHIEALQSELWKTYFKRSEQMRSDESRRPEKDDDVTGERLGIMGSFRKLDID